MKTHSVGLLLIVAVCILGHSTVAGQCSCTDVVFVVDSSGSIGAQNFQEQREFLAHLAGRFDYAVTRVAIVRFASIVGVILNPSSDRASVTNTLSNLFYTQGATFTSRALYTAGRLLNNQRRRTCQGKIFIVTDGRVTDFVFIPGAVNFLRRFNYEVIVLGVTDGIDERELLTIASNKRENFFKTADFMSLEAIASRIQPTLICPQNCPVAGQINYQTCAPCEATCDNQNPPCVVCTPGCACPPGTVLDNGRCILPGDCTPAGPRCYGSASGDPHYTTYDGHRYDLQDRCSHIFSKDCADDTFTVYTVTSDACSRGGNPTCIEEAYIDAAGSRLRLYRSGIFLLHAFEGDVPDTSVISVSQGFWGITVDLRTLGITIQFRKWYLSVCTPNSYAGKLCGLLGDCNGDGTDDFKLMDGTVTDNLLTFETEYRADGITDSCTVDLPQQATCDDPTRRAAAEAFCAPIRADPGPYAACHGTLDPQASFDNCVLDHCLCVQEPEECGCSVILDYGATCRGLGVDTGTPPAVCLPTCPAGQTYKCGPPVPPSCDNPTGVDGVCVDGCFCNDGTVLNANGLCVTEDQCGTCPPNQEFGVYDVPQPTCANPNPSVDGKVRGCSCKAGFVLNEGTGTCVAPDDCPRCYGSASGDPHYTTYDGHRYDLQDRCSHIFSKDCADDTFTVYTVTSDACSRGGNPTCIEEAYIDAAGSRLRLYRSGIFLLHAFEGDVPDTSVISVSQGFWGITVDLRTLGITIQFRKWYLSVCTPGSYAGKLCGFLGDCNGDGTDDFKLMNGTVTDDLLTFETEYRADGITDSCTVDPPQQATCDDPTRRAAAEAFCAPLRADPGPYAACHGTLDPQASFDNCVLDHCLCVQEPEECGCSVILDYGATCRGLGVDTGTPPAVCLPTCPAGQTYKCGPPVPPSCDNPTGVDGVCVDGCFCNDGTVLNANGQCVTEDQCGTCPPNQEFGVYNVPQPTCANPNPSVDGKVRGCSCKAGFVLNEGTGTCVAPGDCPRCYGSASGDPHYTTYDGHRYDLQDRCSHIFTKDCADDTFTVYTVTSDACSRGGNPTCIEEAYIDAAGSRLRLYRSGIFLLHAFEGDVPDTSVISVSQGFWGITVDLRTLGITIQFRKWYLSVCTPGSYAGKLCGFLGDCNGDGTDDFKLMDGTVTDNLLTFETEYRADGITDSCTVDPPQQATCDDPTRRAAAEAFCAPIRADPGPYAACHGTLDPQASFDNCVLDHCLCVQEPEECGCSVILDYGATCRGLGVDTGTPPAVCLPTCPAGQTYKCGPPVPPSCDNPTGVDGVCVDGCFCNDGTVLNANGQCVTEDQCGTCPPNQEFGVYNVPQPTCDNPNPSVDGKVRGCSCKAGFVLNEATGMCVAPVDCPRCYGSASGDPHYTTYDGHRYDLQDRCSHIFTKDCANNTFTVYTVTSDACSRGGNPTCIEEAYIDAAGTRLHLYRRGPVILHDFDGTVPPTSAVSVLQGFGIITVDLRDLGITIQFKQWYLSVCTPGSYAGKLCGFLGDCNGDGTDDFKLMDGTVTDNLLTFETEYRADGITDSCTVDPPQQATCDDPTKRTAAEAFCAPIRADPGPYAACHGTLDPQASFDNCVLDHCLCVQEPEECGCSVILDYGATCRGLGVDTGTPPAVCMLTCPAGQTYKCGPPVPPSCDNPTGVDGVCVDGCFCNDGTILNANGQCVTEDQCGVCPMNEEFGVYDVPQPTCMNLNPDSVGQVRGCSCKAGFVLNETTGMCDSQDTCCDIEGQTFHDCAPCEATCENPNPACPRICRPGCACPVGMVVHEGRCIPQANCQTCPIEGQTYHTCAPCEATCGNPNPPCPRICRPGCACPNGSVVHEGRCIPQNNCPTCQIEGQTYHECAPCRATCGNPNTPCPAICQPGCACPNGTVIHEGRCIPQDNCPTCPIEGQTYHECAPCEATCENPNPACPRICRPGCACPVGMVLHEGKCIPTTDCQICPIPGQMFYQCVPCEATCNNPNPICPLICKPGCGCPPGMVLHEGECIPRDNCPACPFEGQIHHVCIPCQGTCEDPNPPCPRICRPGCGCPVDHVLHENVCIPVADCPADCGNLTSIPNGGVSFNSTTEGSEAIYICDAGYELKGENTRMCQSDGTWSGTEPQCEESRQCQEKVDIVFLVDTSGSVGRRNFNKQQDFLANVVDELPIASDKVRVSEVKYGHRIFFEFSLTEHTDKEDLKDALGNVRYRSFQNTRTGRGIRYVVNNYKGIIEARDDSILILIVVTDGKSQDNVEAPAQAAKDEGFLVIALGVGRNVDENELKQIASEDDLVILADSFNALDTVVKDITDLILECPVDCSEPDKLVDGTVSTPDGTLHPSNATYTCDEGYTLEGNSVITCQADGTWSDGAPVCKIVTCDVPPTPDNMIVDGDFVPDSNDTLVAFGGKLTYTCEVGYVIIGDDERTCQADGTFSGTTPTCTEIPTGTPPPTDKNAVVRADPIAYTVFEAEGKVVLSAELTGTWTTACNVPISCQLGTAGAGDDYEQPTGAFRFEPSDTGTATAELEISLIVDDVLEEEEFFLCFFFTQTTPGVTPAPPPNLFTIDIKDCPADRPFGMQPGQLTCVQPNLPAAPPVKGCYCPAGTVLDERIDQCVPPEDCGKCYGVAYGDPHYLSFDGLRYDLQDRCSHIFTKDCADNTFTVYSITSDDCSGGGAPTCIVGSVIEVPSLDAEVKLFEDLSFEFQENEKTPGNLEVIKTGEKIVVAIHKYSVVVEFKKWYLSVCAPLSYSGKLCGLLGDCNGDKSDDFKLMDGTVTDDLLTFETEYRADGITDTCTPEDPQVAECTDLPKKTVAEEFCSIVNSADGPFADCHQFIDPDTYYDNCVLDACLCTAGTECACGVIRQYATECSRFGVTVETPPVCDVNCTDGMVFVPDAPLIPPTCDNFIGDIAITGPGCTCPPNFVWMVDICIDRSTCTDIIPTLPTDPQPPVPPTPTHVSCRVEGSSHHTTFDGLVHHFQGDCTYILSKDEAGDTFTIYIDKVVCGDGAVCVNEVYIKVAEYAEILKIDKDGQITPADFPTDLFSVDTTGETIIIVLETVGVSVVFKLDLTITIWAPFKFFQQLSGICGNFNLDPTDDLTKMLPDGSTEPTTNVGDLISWQADPCNRGDCTPAIHIPNACSDETMKEAVDFCTILLEDAEYKKCGTHVDPDTFLNSCVFDYCAHTGPDGTTDLSVPCNSIINFGAKCAELGYVNVTIVPPECAVNCGGNLEFQLCGPNKRKTCTDPIGANDFCVSGCFCGEGLVEDGGVCITAVECPVVITWDREEYIVNNDSLPTVCGMLRVTPTERNITVTVSFEAGDMADPPVSGQPSSDCCCGHEGSGFSCSATPCTISVPQQTDTLCVFLPYAEDWPEEVEAEVETDEPAVDIQPFDETTFIIETTEKKCISLESQLFCFNENTCDNKPIGVLLSEMLPNQQTIGSVEVLGATATGGVDFTQGALWPLFQGNKADVCVAIKEQTDFEGYECFHINLKPPESGWVGCEPTKAIGIIEEGNSGGPDNTTNTCYNNPNFDAGEICNNNDEVFIATYKGEIDSAECSLGYEFVVRRVIQGTVQLDIAQRIYVLPIKGCPFTPFVVGKDYLVAGVNNPNIGAGGVTVENNGVILGCEDYEQLLPEIHQACMP